MRRNTILGLVCTSLFLLSSVTAFADQPLSLIPSIIPLDVSTPMDESSAPPNVDLPSSDIPSVEAPPDAESIPSVEAPPDAESIPSADVPPDAEPVPSVEAVDLSSIIELLAGINNSLHIFIYAIIPIVAALVYTWIFGKWFSGFAFL